MNRYLRYVLIIFAAPTILLFGLIIYIIAIFDPNAYKPQIIQLVKDEKQRQLKLDGDIKLVFFPNLGVELNNLSLSEHDSDEEFASAKSARMFFAMLPLLRKRVELDEIVITGLKANLIRFPDGRTNIDDLITRKEEPGEFKFDIERVRVKKTVLAFRDEASERHFVFRDINLEAHRIDRTEGRSGIADGMVRSNVELAFRLDPPDQAEINVAAELTFNFAFDLGEQYYAVKNLSLKSEGQIPAIDHFVMNSTGDFSAKVATDTAAGEFIADKFSLGITGTNAGRNFDVRLDAPRLSLNGENVAGDKITGLVNIISSESNTTGNFSLSVVDGTLDHFQSKALDVDLQSKKRKLIFKTTLASSLRGSVTTRQLSLPDLKIDIHATHHGVSNNGIKGNLLGDASVDGSTQHAQAQLYGTFADGNINAKWAAHGFTQPTLTFQVGIDQLDLERILPLQEGQGAPGKAGFGSPEESFDLGLLSDLEDLEIEGSIRIGLLKVARSRWSNVKLDISSD